MGAATFGRVWSAGPEEGSAVRLAGGGRVAAGVALGAAGSFLGGLTGRTEAFFLVLELAWLPAATAVFLASARPGNPLAVVGGPVIDLTLLFALQVLLPVSREGVLLGYVVVVAFGVYTAGRRPAAFLAAEAIALCLVAQLLVPEADKLRAVELVPFSAAVLALLFMLERTAALQAASEARAAHLQGKSETILAHVADAVIVTDELGALRECNAAAEQLLRMPTGAALGRTCSEVLGLHRGERVLDCSKGCALLEEQSGDGDSLGVEVWRALAGERRQPILANASLVTSAAGAHEVVHSLRDVTRLKEAEEAKNLFLATASHELKTPLTVIQGFADTLSRYPDLDAATKAAALQAIKARSVDLARIVDRLLMSSRIEAGRINLSLEVSDIVPLVAERVRTTASGTRRVIDFDGPPAGAMALANSEALTTVVDHLLDNALKYSPGGQPVQVTLTDDPAEATVGIEVTDHGIGMDREQAAHCFEKFWQAESTDVRRFGGTGIGLYIVQSLVEAMGGSVTVHSQRDEGSTFGVRLRRAPVPPGPEAGLGEATSIREFMRQIGVVQRSRA